MAVILPCPRLILTPSPTDISDIKFVVNYDYPSSAEDYIHRIGRTARANGTGTSYTFFTQVWIKSHPRPILFSNCSLEILTTLKTAI